MKPSSDPFVQKILWDRLVTIADETVNSLIRTSFSMNVRDSYDLSCVIFDEKGRSVAQGTFSLPTFTGTAPQTLQAILERFPVGTFDDGDVFITNDPWLGTADGRSPCARPLAGAGAMKSSISVRLALGSWTRQAPPPPSEATDGMVTARVK